MKAGFITFEDFHIRKNIGSSRIRAKWVAKNWPGAEMYKAGKKYDVEIYQKVYWLNRLKQYPGIKILDVCDPDWLDPNSQIMEAIQHVDAITYPTAKFGEFFGQVAPDVTRKQIPDRLDLSLFKAKKEHKGKAKKVVWFGYAHNQAALKQAATTLSYKNLELTIISNDIRVNLNTLARKDLVKFIKWDENTVHKEIQKCDIAILPPHPTQAYNHQFKSNNKTITAWALGLPVAKNGEELEYYMDEKNRQKEMAQRRVEIREKYDVKLSVIDYLNVISEINDR